MNCPGIRELETIRSYAPDDLNAEFLTVRSAFHNALPHPEQESTREYIDADITTEVEATRSIRPPPVSSREAARWALFLDIDGTLLDIASSPYAVVVPKGLCTTLSTLRDRLGGALALISGRALSRIDSLFQPLRLPAAGQHGAEIRLASGEVVRVWVSPGSLHALRQEVDRVVADLPGILVERKSMGIAVHYRQLPECSSELARRLTDVLARRGRGFHMMCGKFVFELKPRDADKARAIEVFMRHDPFVGRIPVFVGDDRTDEDGFAAAIRLGGHAVRVGTLQPDMPGFRLGSAREVRAWLAS
ncbi:MAG: trehalose-phosphatase [Gammaproteobacteria bacterium]